MTPYEEEQIDLIQSLIEKQQVSEIKPQKQQSTFFGKKPAMEKNHFLFWKGVCFVCVLQYAETERLISFLFIRCVLSFTVAFDYAVYTHCLF